MQRPRASHRLPIIAATILLLVSSAWLLWPVQTGDQWIIRTDPAALTRKTEYLASIQALAHQQPRRNVLLIVADDLGRHDVSFMGDSPFSTPQLDKLAKQSTVYSNAYATAAICAPSRAALLTGRIQNRFGFESQPMQRYVRNLGEYLGFRYLIDTDEMRPFLLEAYPDHAQLQHQGLPVEEVTLADVYSALGYQTGIFGKWHLGYSAQNHPLQFGFGTQYGFMEAFSLFADAGSAGLVEHQT